MLKDLELKGYFLFGEKKLERWKFGDNNEKLEIATLVIKKIESADIIKVDLNNASA